MGNIIPKSTTTITPIHKDIYITCLDNMEKGYNTSFYNTTTCKKCNINIHYNYTNTNLFNKDNCVICENTNQHYIIDILPSVHINS